MKLFGFVLCSLLAISTTATARHNRHKPTITSTASPTVFNHEIELAATSTCSSSSTIVTCTKKKSVKSGDTCANIEEFQNVTDATLHKLNPTLKADCSNLQSLANVCLAGTTSCATSSASSTTTKTPSSTTCSTPVSPTFGNEFFVASGYSARVWSQGIGRPRQMAIDSKGNILVVDTNDNQIWALTGNASNPCAIAKKTLIIDGSSITGGLTHGVSIYGGYVWASNTNNVYRWPYKDGSLTKITTSPTTIITDMAGSDHATRTMAFDPNGNMVIGRGSTANVMEGFKELAVIRRFSASKIKSPPSGGINYTTGTLVSYGNRNEVGLRYDRLGRLWGIENGADVLDRPDLGGEIYPTNPAEELNLFETDGKFYGYPYCWTEYNLKPYTTKGLGAGAQWAYPGFMPTDCNSTYSRCDVTDSWCRQSSNNVPPKLALEAHNAPLDVNFYERNTTCKSAPGFPCSQIHDAFAAMHGSSLKNLPHGEGVGYKVVHIPFDSNTNLPAGTVNDIFGQKDLTSCPGTCIRPVSVVFDLQGRLFVSSDNTGEVFMITRNA